MFKHTVVYNDFNGQERKEELHFHLSKPEVIRIEAEIGTDLATYTQSLVDNMELKTLLDFLERIILNSYGKKTTDGRSFHKSKELREDFEHSQAYAELFEQLLLTPELARKFGESVADDGKQRKNQVQPSVVGPIANSPLA